MVNFFPTKQRLPVGRDILFLLLRHLTSLLQTRNNELIYLSLLKNCQIKPCIPVDFLLFIIYNYITFIKIYQVCSKLSEILNFYHSEVVGMYPKERLDSIMAILKKNGYVTVKFLTDELHYSTATINRDLNILANKKLIRRSYGGVELIEKKGSPMAFRYHKMRAVKNKLAKKAAEFIKDGETIFIDSSTTTQCIGPYLTTKKDITVITNNIALVSYLSEYGINVICLGGRIVDPPAALCSTQTVENASNYIADKFFFSTGGITDDGKILSGGLMFLLQTTMARNSKSVFYLVDHDKININSNRILFDLNEVSCIITDFDFDNETKEKFKNTQFINVSS